MPKQTAKQIIAEINRLSVEHPEIEVKPFQKGDSKKHLQGVLDSLLLEIEGQGTGKTENTGKTAKMEAESPKKEAPQVEAKPQATLNECFRQMIGKKPFEKK